MLYLRVGQDAFIPIALERSFGDIHGATYIAVIHPFVTNAPFVGQFLDLTGELFKPLFHSLEGLAFDTYDFHVVLFI
jgi:hypothetical protein